MTQTQFRVEEQIAMQSMKVFVLALVASGFVVFAGADARADLLGYYQFDDGTANDSSGLGNHATLQGGAVVDASGGISGGLTDGALNLGSTNNGAGATIANAATGAFDSLTANNAGSVSLWVYGDGAQPSSDTAFGLYDAGNLRQFQSHLPWGDGTIYFDVGGGGGGANRISKAEGTAANYSGQWNHYVFTKDGNQSRIYQNGTLWHSGTTTASIGSITQAFIGSEHTLTNSYGGEIDEFAVFDQALSTQQIQRLAGGVEASSVDGFRNIALIGTATQSSTLSNPNNPVASKAIDGNTDGTFNNSSVTHTSQAGGTPVWWQVELAGDVMIAGARLFNRTDCCGGRLSNYTVSVLDESGATVFEQDYHAGSGNTGVSEFIAIPGTVVGNRLRVDLIGDANNSDNVLSLAEVQAFGMIRNGDNFAKFGTATQSTTLAPASRANDGNTNGLYGNNSVSHTATNTEPDPWWRVDLGVDRYIDGVQIFERTDSPCCDNRLTNFDVRVLDANLNVVWEGLIADVPNAGNRIGVGTGYGSFGRYVEIQMNDTGSDRTLELAEVEVFAGKVRNIARGGTASQSSTAGSRTADHAIDGNVTGWEQSFAQNPYAHTGNVANSWWQVDLGGLSEIENIILYNRLDSNGERLSNFRVSIELNGLEVWGEDYFGTGNAGELFRIDLDDIVLGSIVKVQLNGLNNQGTGVLQLAEVQVWGTVVPTPAALPAGLLLLTAAAMRRRRR